MPERLAVLRVAERLIERRLGDPDGSRGNVDPPDLERTERHLHASALIAAEQTVIGDEAVLEHDFAALGAFVAELADVLRHGHARRTLLDHQHAHALVRRSGGRIGLGQNRHRVRVAGVGDPHFGSVEDVAPVDLLRRRPDALKVGSGIRLRQCDARAAGACREFGKPAQLLLFGAVIDNHLAGERVAAEDAGDPHPPLGDLLEHDRHRHEVGVHAAIRSRDGDAEEPELFHLLDDLGRIATFVLPVSGNRTDFSVDEVTHRLLEHLVFV